MSRELIEEINRKINITEIVENYLTLKKAGNRYIGLCPFHNEKTPSFSVTPESNLFYCFGCHKGGDMIKFVMEIEKIDFKDALEFLARKAGISLEKYFNKSFSSESKNKQALKELYKKTALSFSFILENKEEAKSAREYLYNRGLTNQIIKDFQIGWAPESRGWLSNFLKSKNYSEDFLSKSGLFSRKGLSWSLFSGRIMFPIKNQSGDVVAFSGRTLKDFGPKYINSPETLLFKKKYNFFGLSNALKAIRAKDFAVLCEGQMDVIAYHQAGINNAIAPLGTSFTEEQAALIKRYTSNVILSFDGDEAGKKAMLKAIILCEKNNISTKIVLFKKNEDPSDLIQDKGVEALQNIIKSNINSFDFVINNAVNRFDMQTPEGKERFIQDISAYISSINSNVRKESCIRKISEIIGINYNSVYADLSRGKNISRKTIKKENTIKNKHITSDLFLMIAVVVNREKFSYVRSRLSVDELEDKRAKEIFIALEESYRNDETEIESILSRIEDDSAKAILAENITSEKFSMNNEEIIKDIVKKIKTASFLKKRAEIEKKLRNISKNSEYTYLESEILSEKMYIDREIEKLR